MDCFAIVKEGVIKNIIRADAPFAKSIGALPAYEGAAIGDVYAPSGAAQKREEAYNTRPVVAWGGEMLTVTQAAQKWQYYAAEGNEKAEVLQALIREAKAAIREEFPEDATSSVTADAVTPSPQGEGLESEEATAE